VLLMGGVVVLTVLAAAALQATATTQAVGQAFEQPAEEADRGTEEDQHQHKANGQPSLVIEWGKM
jgi:hypothetical protein